MSQTIPAQETKRGSTLVWILKAVLVAVVLYFLYQQIARNWDEIQAFQWKIHSWGLLAISILLGLTGLLVLSSVWRFIIAALGHRLSIGDAFRISYLSQLGRYIPGKVWQLFGILYLAKEKGVSPEKATASFVISQLFLIPSSLLIFAAVALLEPEIFAAQIGLIGPFTMYGLAGAMVLGSAALVVRPNWFLGLGNMILRKIGRPAIEFAIDKKVALGVFLGYSCGWIIFGIAFFCFIKSAVPSTNLGLLPAIGIYNGAYQIGYLAMFAPGGFGPRELVMGQMLAPYLAGLAPAVTILCRLWSIVVELIASALALLVRK
jgi:uncharacterized membrane protein YbhN (UPF0104 family)